VFKLIQCVKIQKHSPTHNNITPPAGSTKNPKKICPIYICSHVPPPSFIPIHLTSQGVHESALVKSNFLVQARVDISLALLELRYLLAGVLFNFMIEVPGGETNADSMSEVEFGGAQPKSGKFRLKFMARSG
jgi:hypothetical protein